MDVDSDEMADRETGVRRTHAYPVAERRVRCMGGSSEANWTCKFINRYGVFVDPGVPAS